MSSPEPSSPEELSERELRKLYDDEETERFLRIFTTHITEVQATHNAVEGRIVQNDNIPSQDEKSSEEQGYEVNTLPSLSEVIAANVVVPLLPAGPNARPDFTLSRLRLAVQRLYLSLEPIYWPFMMNMKNLATWSDRRKSFKYCLIFWILWWYNLLLPSLFLRILYSLLRRRIFPYPSFAELQEHRERVNRAAEISDDLSTTLANTTFDVRDLWMLYKHIKPTKRRNEVQATTPTNNDSNTEQERQAFDEDQSHLMDAKSEILYTLNLIADCHERVIKDPASSRFYGGSFFFLFLLTYFIPVQHLCKLSYFICGFMFWHIAPIVSALSLEDRNRFPPPLAGVPTDAEFAMQMISKRVANGYELTPKKRLDEHRRDDDSTATGAQKADIGARIRPDDQVNWSKWGGRFAAGKTWIMAKRVSSVAEQSEPNFAATEKAHSYPAQHHSSTGLLTITSNSLYFTPAISKKASLEIPLHTLRIAKKSDTLTVKGLILKWMDIKTNMEKEEYIVWVGGRDELFARLVGREGGRWLKI
ncbi:hypothetical protein APHAL10511_006388 [Amanita phalloides]|nr:hypothetical protein APHAL10511_006388 [Amanita phalloides]